MSPPRGSESFNEIATQHSDRRGDLHAGLSSHALRALLAGGAGGGIHHTPIGFQGEEQEREQEPEKVQGLMAKSRWLAASSC